MGGGAVAYEAAMGNSAWAKQFAVGSHAVAEHMNDDVAKQAIAGQPAKRMLDFFVAHQVTITVMTCVLSITPALLVPFMYRRESKTSDA